MSSRHLRLLVLAPKVVCMFEVYPQVQQGPVAVIRAIAVVLVLLVLHEPRKIKIKNCFSLQYNF